jgi:predicted hotdog family 3-hydroxylacyl-ACP dehydratase
VKPTDIAQLVPQRGPMCLLHEVAHSDERGIVCSALSHRSPDNPLRRAGMLPALAGLDDAAQALAAHCALLARARNGGPAQGLLAGVREVVLHVARLDDIDAPLTVRAERLVANGPRLLYGFAIEAGQRKLLNGRVAVVLRGEAAA